MAVAALSLPGAGGCEVSQDARLAVFSSEFALIGDFKVLANLARRHPSLFLQEIEFDARCQVHGSEGLRFLYGLGLARRTVGNRPNEMLSVFSG